MDKISFRAARINAKLSAKEVAEEIGVTEDTIYNYEKGKTSPKFLIVRVLAKLYGVDPGDFKEVSGE